MRRFAVFRFWYFVLFACVVVIQIALNLLFSSCGENSRIIRNDRDIALSAVNHRVYSEQLRTTQHTVASLKLALAHTREDSSELERLRKENAALVSQLAKHTKLERIISAQEYSTLKAEVSKLEFLKGDVAYNEWTVVPFDSFTNIGIFTVTKEGLVTRPARRPMGTRQKEHEEILNFAVQVLNDEFPREGKFEAQHLANGITRLHRLNGMGYELIFADNRPKQYKKLKIRRPYSNIELVDGVETVDTSKEPINLILPLSSNTEKFEVFLKRFGDVCIRWDGNVFLTVVYFGEEGRADVLRLLSEFEERESFKDYKLITEDGIFSRGGGLQKGALSWDKGNNIMFFCDVDIYFMPDFLERCRLYAEPNKMVYYPIVYSLYNPEVVYNGKPPSIDRQLYIGKNNGFWRDFGFGMTCVYRNDFVSTGGFDTSIHGWGVEDLKLYREFLKSDLAVIRATDRGIFHLYHPKLCDASLPSEQYLSCLESKAVSEGSHRQMGMLAFGNRLFSNLRPNWNAKLQYTPDLSRRISKLKSKEAVELWKTAEELGIDVVEIELLRDRLATVMNATVFGQDAFKLQQTIINVSVLEDFKLRVRNVTQVIKQLAYAVERNGTKTP